MSAKILTFSSTEIEKKKYFTAIRLLFLFLIDISVLVSNKISFGEKNYKYLMGYLYNGNKVKL